MIEPEPVPAPAQPEQPIAPKTTTQEDLVTAGQRVINLIWETTQGRIAVYVVMGSLLIDASVLLVTLITGRDLTAAQALMVGVVNSLATGVMSFYFSRTNHENIGGVGDKPSREYTGR